MSQQYTIFLLKGDLENYEDALDPEANVSEPHLLSNDLTFEGRLYLGQQRTGRPAWVDLLNPHLENRVTNARVAGISAVLLVRYENRFFAFTFGHGKSLLTPSCWVSDFGLKVTLNRIDPQKIRSLDSRYYEEMVVSERKQTSRASDLGTFEVDVARDLVRAVTGEPSDTTFAKRLSGSDSLTVATDLEFADLGDLCDDLLVAYSETAYQANFPWVDYVREVRDVPLIDELNELLVEAIRSSNLGLMHLAPPEFIDWSEEMSFKYTGTGRNSFYSDLDLNDYLGDHIEELPTLTMERLKGHAVKIRKAGHPQFERAWSVFDCLVWETIHNGLQYALFDRRWFQIEAVYAQRVLDFVNGIPQSQLALSDAVLGQTERQYNAHQEQQYPNQYALMDRRLFAPITAPTQIEFCDLFDLQGRMIHVKKRSSSSTLSHLFSQGSVASEAFLRDQTLREAIRVELVAMNKPVHAQAIQTINPTAANYSVAFVMIAKDAENWPPRLPFFSTVNLMHHANRIQSLGYMVTLQYVRAI